MNVLLIDASARADGLTGRMGDAAGAGAREAGAVVDRVALQELAVERLHA